MYRSKQWLLWHQQVHPDPLRAPGSRCTRSGSRSASCAAILSAATCARRVAAQHSCTGTAKARRLGRAAAAPPTIHAYPSTYAWLPRHLEAALPYHTTLHHPSVPSQRSAHPPAHQPPTYPPICPPAHLLTHPPAHLRTRPPAHPPGWLGCAGSAHSRAMRGCGRDRGAARCPGTRSWLQGAGQGRAGWGRQAVRDGALSRGRQRRSGRLTSPGAAKSSSPLPQTARMGTVDTHTAPTCRPPATHP